MSALRDALAKYVAIRRALGSKLGEPAVTLGHFLEFLERQGAQFITTELALRWALKCVGRSNPKVCSGPHGHEGSAW